jgi:hypothetical protein
MDWQGNLVGVTCTRADWHAFLVYTHHAKEEKRRFQGKTWLDQLLTTLGRHLKVLSPFSEPELEAIRQERETTLRQERSVSHSQAVLARKLVRALDTGHDGEIDAWEVKLMLARMEKTEARCSRIVISLPPHPYLLISYRRRHAVLALINAILTPC